MRWIAAAVAVSGLLVGVGAAALVASRRGDTESLRPVCCVWDARFSPDGMRFVTASEGGIAQVPQMQRRRSEVATCVGTATVAGS